MVGLLSGRLSPDSEALNISEKLGTGPDAASQKRDFLEPDLTGQSVPDLTRWRRTSRAFVADKRIYQRHRALCRKGQTQAVSPMLKASDKIYTIPPNFVRDVPGARAS